MVVLAILPVERFVGGLKQTSYVVKTDKGIINSETGALVSAGDELLQQSAFKGPEMLNGFKIWGNKGLVGETYQRNILLIEADKKGATSLITLLKSFESEATKSGASRISITGHAIINKKLVNDALAKRLGYTFRKINEETIELVKSLE